MIGLILRARVVEGAILQNSFQSVVGAWESAHALWTDFRRTFSNVCSNGKTQSCISGDQNEGLQNQSFWMACGSYMDCAKPLI